MKPIDYLKKLLSKEQHQTNTQTPSSDPQQNTVPAHEATQDESQIEKMEEIQKVFTQDGYDSQTSRVLANMQMLKSIVDQPKEDRPELRFNQIRTHLGEPECHQTVREERWHPSVFCPYCESTNVKRLDPAEQKSRYNFRYQCVSCSKKFNDDSETPFEGGFPPLEVWMQVWYLVGCTTSLPYIAAKLNLDPQLVQQMINQLQKVFNAKQPLTKFLKYEEWAKQAGHYKKAIKEHIMKKGDLLKGYSVTQPGDTAEYRRQKERRERPSTSPRSKK